MYSSTTSGEMLRADETLVLVHINGVPHWQAQDGSTFPQVAGAEDPPPAGAKTEDPPNPKSGAGDGADDDDFDKPRAMATIKQLRERERATKEQLKELDTLKAQQKKRDDAEKSESDRLKEQVAESERKATAAQQKLTETQNRIAIERAATKANASDPDDVFRLLDPTDFELDADGNVTNAEKLVTDLIKKKPYLAGKPNGTSGVPATPRGAAPAGRDEQVEKNREELKASGHYNPLG